MTVEVPATREVVVALVATRLVVVKLVKKVLILESIEAKKLVEVAADRLAIPDAIFTLDIEVVAKVDVPCTIDSPDVVALPLESTVKLVFSVQAVPFQ